MLFESLLLIHDLGLLFLSCLQLLLMFGLDGLCFKNQLVSSLPLFLYLGQELIVLHTDNFLLSSQCLLGLYLQFHVIIEQLLVLTKVAYSLKLFVNTTPFSKVIVTNLHVAKSTKFYLYFTIFSSLPGPVSTDICCTDLYLTQIIHLLIGKKLQFSSSEAFFF